MRASWRVVGGGACRILATPRGGVTFREFTQRIQISSASTKTVSSR